MKNVKKGLLAAAAIATVGSIGVVGVGATHAATNTNASNDPMSGLVDKLVNKFKLNKSDVQKVFEENRAEMEAKHEVQVSERLQKLVDAGTITSDQKAKIEAKLKELKAERESNRDAMKDLSDSERKAKMDTKKTELENWAKENGIDLAKLQGVFHGPGMGHMERGPNGPDMQPLTTNN